MLTKTLQFLALTLTTIALIPSGTHLFELPHKIALAQGHGVAIHQQSVVGQLAAFC